MNSYLVRGLLHTVWNLCPCHVFRENSLSGVGDAVGAHPDCPVGWCANPSCGGCWLLVAPDASFSGGSAWATWRLSRGPLCLPTAAPDRPRPRGGASAVPHFRLRGSCGIRLSVSAQTPSTLGALAWPAGFPTPSSPVWRTGSKPSGPGIWACFQHLRACDHQTLHVSQLPDCENNPEG